MSLRKPPELDAWRPERQTFGHPISPQLTLDDRACSQRCIGLGDREGTPHTRRSQVQVLPPLLKAPGNGVPCSNVLTSAGQLLPSSWLSAVAESSMPPHPPEQGSSLRAADVQEDMGNGRGQRDGQTSYEKRAARFRRLSRAAACRARSAEVDFASNVRRRLAQLSRSASVIWRITNAPEATCSRTCSSFAWRAS